MLLSPEQSAVYTSIMQGCNVVWLSERQAGKTFVGAQCLYALSGTMVAGNPMQRVTNSRIYPDIFHLSPQFMKAINKNLPLVVFDNFDMYDYTHLLDMLKVEAQQKLFLATHWSRTSLSSASYEMVLRAMPEGTKIFST